MELRELAAVISGKTDIHVVAKGVIIHVIKHDDYPGDVPRHILTAEAAYLTAVDYRTVEIGIKGDCS